MIAWDFSMNILSWEFNINVYVLLLSTISLIEIDPILMHNFIIWDHSFNIRNYSISLIISVCSEIETTFSLPQSKCSICWLTPTSISFLFSIWLYSIQSVPVFNLFWINPSGPTRNRILIFSSYNIWCNCHN